MTTPVTPGSPVTVKTPRAEDDEPEETAEVDEERQSYLEAKGAE